MVYTANAKNKRKNESTDVKIEPAMKALKKCDLIIQIKDLQKNNEALTRKTKSC